ncbi:LLM class flavin-dependent oxidoreductase [Actinoplanes sp. N902-109]|uniref:LLM class flavin-dependent oxidoreductase n=1 Tax=Actinoplanes sp. (strain N902-109) TaxID=649831 RepID=UPI0003293E53|nr:LLM class flavin-dependent oxidoreductase [Actinoplanes sp. N902-109]AGL17381.1 coenzyme F420-dependent N5 N10-methylene tetrahydromethanopterin reductase-like protein [Actinoplanes sp. N902-109]
MARIGIMYDRDLPPEDLPAFARTVEECGADDLWVVEDLGWSGSISAAALALAATTGLRVGIGIAPVPLRNPVLLAMEIATLARVHPGRLVAGLGHGIPEWMRKAGAEPARKLAALEETIVAVRALLRGTTVTMTGHEVTIDGVSLVHPPQQQPPLVTGVVGPRSLALSGRHADGTVLPEGFGPARIREAITTIAAPVRAQHETIVFTYLHTGPDAATATAEAVADQAAWLGVPPSAVYSLIGPPAEAPARVEALFEAGADTVVLRPLGPDPLPHVRAALSALGR